MTKTPLLIEHLDLWCAALAAKSASGRGNNGKLELYGLKKLRELILELAVRGLLVPQDPHDEPASALLKKIKAEKARLIKEGKIKKQKNLLPITEDEKPFDLPQGWEYARFGNVVFNRDAERIPLSVDERKDRQGNFDYYGASGVIDSIDDYLFDKPLLLIGEDGANLINRSTPIAFIARGKYWVNNHAHVLDGLTEELLRYVCLHINAISLEPYITGTAQPKMNQAKMNSIVLSIPPEQEQHRIVAKVDELMALCERLEARQEASISTHRTLVHTLLSALTDVGRQGRFEQAWARIAEHFDILFTTEESIDLLKQSILQLAVMGRLVPQNPQDEPASALLKKIAAEKTRLIKKGKIKKQKKLPPIREDEKPFDLPQGWEWVRFGEIAQHNAGKTLDHGRNTGQPRDYLTTSNLYWGRFDLSEVRQMLIREDELDKCTAKKGDLLICEGGEAGRAAVWDEDYEICFQNHVHRARFYCDINPYYAYRYFEKLSATGEIEKYRKGVGISSMSGKSLASVIFALPPLSEQIRIVARVDELMALCDRLHARIRAARAAQQQLADAMAERAKRHVE